MSCTLFRVQGRSLFKTSSGCRGLATALAVAKRDRAKARIAQLDAASDTPVAPQLIDSFERRHDYLRISLTEKCNLRCFYCMPEEGVELSPQGSILTDDEVIRLAGLFVRNGITKIRLTGGEPTVRKGIVELVARLSDLRSLGLKSIGMTSNGLALHRKLPDLVRHGLTHLNLSLDTLDEFKFELITRRRGHDAVLRSLDVALNLPDLYSVKLNVVVVKGLNDSEVPNFVEMTKTRPMSVRFIEFMPFSGNKWDKSKMVSAAELLQLISTRYPDIHKAGDEPNDTARSYVVPGHIGSIGFISSMSDHFCGTCNRLRITADGNIKVCLFGPNEVSLRDALRSGATDHTLMDMVGKAVGRKKEKHADHIARDSQSLQQRAPRLRYIGSHLSLCSSPSQGRQARTFYHTSAVLHSSSNVNSMPRLSHIDESGRPSMVDVSDKDVSSRTATAVGRISLNEVAFSVICDPDTVLSKADSEYGKYQRPILQALSKGPVLMVAELAGIQAAKSTSSLIPLCHPLSLSHISVKLTPCPDDRSVRCQADVKCEGKTGVEMEALTAASVALLTVWDMVKALAGREMQIDGLMVVQKTGGKSGTWSRRVDADGAKAEA